jgi:hypothetical protein
MKFFISFILIVFLGFAFGLYLPWWSIALAAFIVSALIPVKPGWAFLVGFISLFLLWGGLAWYQSVNNNHILAHRMSQVILKKDEPAQLAFLTALIGAVVGGFAALSGRLLRSLLR